MILDQFKLNEKTALVTGVTRGLGRAMAIGLAEAGADIVGLGRDFSNSDTEERVTGTGRAFTPYRCDLGNRQELLSVIEDIHQAHPQVDILVNNAGMILRKPAAEHPDEYFDQVIDVNLNAQFILAKSFGARMLKRGSGKIIFTASLLSFQGGITVPGYAASKHGIDGLVKALSNEWAGRGVQVNAIAPGYFATDNTQALRDDRERSQAILGRIPAGRWGDPDDLKGAVVFLASTASDYMSGHTMVVDGGWMAR